MTGIQHLLLLTGEAKEITPTSYLVEAVRCLKRHFASVSIELFPMDEPDYRQLKEAGVDGLTMFQDYNIWTMSQKIARFPLLPLVESKNII